MEATPIPHGDVAVERDAVSAAEPLPPAGEPERAPSWWPWSSPLAWPALLLILLYQRLLSPLLGPTCRFEPSCSRYAAACLRRFGLVRGAYLATRRILRCHPFHPGGYDPPPARWFDAGGRGSRDGGQ
jgi:putative membrane protein insertion efficiency factor